MSRNIYWRLIEPDYESDYDEIYINGYAGHEIGLPGVECAICGQTWSGSKVLTFQCPKGYIEKLKEQDGWPISNNEFTKMKEEITSLLQQNGIKVDKLKPGDKFQPAMLDIPTIPEVDFLWASMGSVIVSERIKEIFQQNNITGVEFFPVELNNVGKNKVSFPAPIPSSGEPEDIFDEVDYLEDCSDVGNYYEMVATSESGRPPGVEITSVCNSCGREEYDDRKRLFMLTDDMINDNDDVFLFSTTLWIIVTNEVKEILESVGATNISFKKMKFLGED